LLTDSPPEANRPVRFGLALGAWLGVTCAVALLDPLTRGVGWIHANLGGLAALLFLLLPGRVAPAGHPLWDPARTAVDGARRALVPTSIVVLLTAVAFVPGYHLYATTFRGESAAWDASSLLRPAERFHGVPTVREREVVYAWDAGGVFVATVASVDEITLRVETDGRFEGHEPDRAGDFVEATTRGPARPATVRVVPRDATSLTISLDNPETPVRSELLTGASSRPFAPDTDGRYRIGLTPWWLLAFALVHLLLVAFPEEFFYRAMLLPALGATEVGARAVSLGPISLTAANVATSLLFALAHFAVGLDPSRLAVFFPSLVFGLLRERTGTITGGIVYHAFCNVLLQVVSLQYVAL
jgi:hypothetical protein